MSRTTIAILGVTGLVMLGGAARSREPSHAAEARRSHPTPLSQSAPDRTDTIKPKDPAPAQAADDDLAIDSPLPPLFNLPSASRTRMRECGKKWQSMKSDGTAGDEIWRNFANRCLASEP